MATQIYLGNPPENIKKWIKADYDKKLTKVVYADGTTWEGLIEGVVDYDKLVSIGLMSQEDGPPYWIKEPKEIIIGNKVTQICYYLFPECTQLESVTIQSDKTEHEFGYMREIYVNCQALSSFPNSTMKYVGQLFDTGCFILYSDSLPFTYNITCKDGVVNAVTNSTQDWGGNGFNISFDGYVQQTKTTFIFDNGNRHDIYHSDSNVLNKTVFDDDDFLSNNDYLNNVKEIIVGNNITQFETPDPPNGTFAGFSKLETVYLPDNIVDVGDCLFNQTYSLKSLPNTTTEQLVQWIETKIETFSPYNIKYDGDNISYDGGAEYTITCKNGIVHAIALGEFDEYECWNPTSWEITVTPL